MLTKDLLRYRLGDGRIAPQLLKATPASRELASALLTHWHEHIGERRGTITDGLTTILHRGRSLVVAKGLNRVIEQRARFAEHANLAALRADAFDASAQHLDVGSFTDVAEHRSAIAEQLGLEDEALSEQLYQDLPEFERLETVDMHHADTVIQHYNLQLCQSLLLYCNSVDIRIADPDIARRRRFLSSMKFRALLAELCSDAEAEVLHLRISGPGAVLQQAQRYGLALAQLLPALVALSDWQLDAELRAPRREQRGLCRLHLDHELGLHAPPRQSGAYQPEAFATLKEQLARKHPEWELDPLPPLLTLPGGDLVVPDFSITVDDQRYPVECFHRWHQGACERRLAQLAEHPGLPLLIGIDRSIANHKAIAPLLEDPVFQQRGFRFRDFPSQRALIDAIKRQQAAT